MNTGYTRMDKKKNADIHQQLKVVSLLDILKITDIIRQSIYNVWSETEYQNRWKITALMEKRSFGRPN